jgi:YHS domain-containing protein
MGHTHAGERFTACPKEGIMKKDMVCGVQVDEETATNMPEYGGETFHFCSPACKAKFDRRPEAYSSSGERIHEHLSAVFRPPFTKSKPG